MNHFERLLKTGLEPKIKFLYVLMIIMGVNLFLLIIYLERNAEKDVKFLILIFLRNKQIDNFYSL